MYKTKEEVYIVAEKALHKTLREIIPTDELAATEAKLLEYGSKRKGFFGDLVEKYIFGMENNGRAEADFLVAGVELKTTPLKKHPQKLYVSKERLVFSMIDYDKVVKENWETSSFLEKNSLLLLMFYLYLKEKSILDYEFKFVHLLDLLKDISAQDVAQIKKDWEFIVAKIDRGEAHLLSEGDTYYLGACTKAKNSSVVREQPQSRIPAKPRAFSLKQTYLNYIIQRNLLGREVEAVSIFTGVTAIATVDDVIKAKFNKYLGKTGREIATMLNWETELKSKSFKRLLANRILTGTGSNEIAELEKANITLRVITLEPSGSLKESISFPAFDYKDLVTQVWYDENEETMSDFHAQLEMNKFLFVVFQKVKGSTDIVLKKIKFWNFPMSDLGEVERIFEKTKDCINEGRYSDLPKISESVVAHVRPHGADSSDTAETPQHTQEMKRCFWLNAKYIQKAIES